MADILHRLMTETWPARMAQSALSALMAPGNAYQSTMQNPVTTGEMVAPSADLAGLIMGGTFGGAPRGAIGAGPVRPRTALEEVQAALSAPREAPAPRETGKDALSALQDALSGSAPVRRTRAEDAEVLRALDDATVGARQAIPAQPQTPAEIAKEEAALARRKKAYDRWSAQNKRAVQKIIDDGGGGFLE